MYERFKALKVTRERGVVRIVLDNPPLNGTTPQMHWELSKVFRFINDDPEAHVVVITGAGDRGFCAGGDVKGMVQSSLDHDRWSASMREAREIVTGMLACDMPVIARINGHAVGFGASLALCSDITIMADGSKIGDTHVKIGLVCGDGGALLWPHLVGLVTTRKWLLSGELMKAQEAFDIGLITEVAAREDLDARTEFWVEKFLNTPSLALKYTKRAMNTVLRQQAEQFMDAHLGLETLTHLDAEHREAVAAVAENRAPVYHRG
jgi:enoyl-CoA hydratase